MGNSLQDQFLKMGLVDKKKHTKAKKDKHDRKKGPQAQQKNDIADMAREALAEKKKRDKQLNKKKIAERQAKEATAKARQLIETHKIQVDPGDIVYNFKYENRIKKLLLSQKTIDSLAKGKIGIVKQAGEFQFVPAETIYRVRELNRKMVVLLNAVTEKSDGDDPYAGYEVPDDLMW
ncbi:MAG TPA: DUF2058 domain-containing protein [Desulfopila sp.]|nr:DUF2058 domain-containing protein [Desulfopila sp.]